MEKCLGLFVSSTVQKELLKSLEEQGLTVGSAWFVYIRPYTEAGQKSFEIKAAQVAFDSPYKLYYTN